MASKYKWFGPNVSNKCSLFDEGFLMRLESRGFYKVCVYIGSGYVFGTFWLKAWLEDLTEEEWSELAKVDGSCNSTEEYKKLIKSMSNHDKAVTLFNDLMAITDLDTLLGWTSCNPAIYSENEVKIRLNRALAA